MSVWDKFSKLKTFKIMFLDKSDAKRANIFGNGNNQVKILIQINIESTEKYNDEYGKSQNYDLDVTNNELSEVLSLVTYQTGEKLSRDNNKSSVLYWNTSTSESAFSTAFDYDMVFSRSSDTVSLKSGQDFIFHVSAKGFYAGQDIDIAAQIDIPGVGVFNTTAKGTDTINGPKPEEGKIPTGSVFKMPSYVQVHARNKIDYSDKNNLSLWQSGWAPVGRQKFIIHNYKVDSKYWVKENGASLFQSIVEVHPNQSDKLKFVSVVFSADNRIQTNELLDGKAKWHHVSEPGIQLKDDNITAARMSAIEGFGKNVDHPDYDVYFWGSPKKLNGQLSGYCHMADSVWQYKVYINIPFNTNIYRGGVSIIGHKISIPTGRNVYSNHWHGKAVPAEYSVVDNYGNEGKIRINFFVDQTHYENPGKVGLG